MDIQTKYGVGDKVFGVWQFFDDTWRVEECTIETAGASAVYDKHGKTGEITNAYYMTGDPYDKWDERDLFATLEEAEQERNRRNQEEQTNE